MDDSVEFLDSAADFLSRDPHVKVVGRARSVWEGLRLVADLKPDLVLMDLAMPVMNGLVATRYIKAHPHPPAVVIVTMHEDAEYQRSANEASADGFVCKSRFAEEIPALVDSFLTAQHRHREVAETP